jgi:hypothetical protein
MSEAHEQAPPGGRRNSEQIDTVCNVIRKGLEKLSDALTPPEAAGKHFREARIEVLRGIRELIDHRIDRLSRSHSQGTRVTVE